MSIQTTEATQPVVAQLPPDNDLDVSRTTTIAVEDTEKQYKDIESGKGSHSSPDVSPLRKQAILLTLSLAQFFDFYSACAAIIALPTVCLRSSMLPCSV